MVIDVWHRRTVIFHLLFLANQGLRRLLDGDLSAALEIAAIERELASIASSIAVAVEGGLFDGDCADASASGASHPHNPIDRPSGQ
jgi:hypothetical protein